MSAIPMRSRLVVTLAASALCATEVLLVAIAPRAHADDGFYLDLLNGGSAYKKHSQQTLLQEGRKICSAISRDGASEDNATDMVQSDLGISNDDAYRVVAAAELGLGCFSLKPTGI
ncbi:hypothetical protein A5621_13355 [Mycobacterium colombiense]|uniref:DUF732 domain-containing protein n=1 Tax=Mycobacterium colombiense TaxID=339268 RepID=UPI0007FF7F21|nr:DUF732 domain-containing protein [Mycobacterium colombiense]OBJ38350.1 hypothetical protein A5621_13355 [Mycobacterium colombiense]